MKISISIVSLFLMSLVAFDSAFAIKKDVFQLRKWDALWTFKFDLLAAPKRYDNKIDVRTKIFIDKEQLLNALKLIKITRDTQTDTSMFDITALEDKIVETAALQSQTPENATLIKQSLDKGYQQGYSAAKFNYSLIGLMSALIGGLIGYYSSH